MENSIKKSWITLKTLCLYLGISSVLLLNLTACKSLPPKPVQACTLTENNALAAARDGNLAVVKDYLENGGDPMLECTMQLVDFYAHSPLHHKSYGQFTNLTAINYKT